jgi:hypothetical protein
MLGLISRSHLVIVGVLAFIFAVSANMAWLNPDPNYVIKTHERIPIMWQYNGDSVVEFLSAAFFPDYFKTDKTRTNRPGYPLAVKVLSEAIGIIVWPFYKMSALLQTMLGYTLLKALVYLAGALALFSIGKRFLPERASLYAVLLAFLHPFAVTFAATFHTSELQFLTPIFLVWMWLNLGDKYTHKKNILFSLIIGYLMLTKQNYAVYLTLLTFSFFIFKRYKESILSFLMHLIPLAVWFISLKILDIPYYNHETETYKQGVWLYQDLLLRNPLEIIKILISSINRWLENIAVFFSLFGLAALIALGFAEIRAKLNRRWVIFFILALGFSWLQTLAANRYAPYMSSDISFLIWPLAGYALYQFSLIERWRKLIPLIFSLYFLAGLTTIMSFPWIHPYQHKGVTNPERVKLLEEGKLVPRDNPSI